MSGLKRTAFWTGVVALCAWVLVPIWLIALGAFGGRSGVFRWPKSLWPGDASLAALQTFLAVEGVWPAMVNSIIAALTCMALSIGLGAPAGYALARFSFRGQNAYRLLILLTRGVIMIGERAMGLGKAFVN